MQIRMQGTIAPCESHHSSWGLGCGPNEHTAFVYTKALLAEACGWKRRDGIFGKNFSFLLYIKWASNVRGYPLPRTACWGSPKPQYTQKVFCSYAFRERFLCIIESSKSPDSEKSQVIFCSLRRRIIWFVVSHIEFNSKSLRSRYVTLDVMWCMVLC